MHAIPNGGKLLVEMTTIIAPPEFWHFFLARKDKKHHDDRSVKFYQYFALQGSMVSRFFRAFPGS
jgi:hypothetical protein